jgi:hypothetical protein
MKIQGFAIKEQDKDFRIVNSELFKHELNSLQNGKYTVTVQRYRRNKSHLQLGYYYSCVLPMFRQAALEQGWEFESIEEVDLICKELFAGKEIVNRHTGELITIPAFKTDMSTVEFMTFIDKIRNYCSEYFGVAIPDPEKQTDIPFKDNAPEIHRNISRSF